MTRAWILFFLAIGLSGFVPRGAEAQPSGLHKLSLKEAKFVPASAAPGETVVLEVSVTPRSGWHIYGKKEETGIPPSLVSKKGSSPFLTMVGKLDLPDGERHAITDDLDTYWLAGTTTLRQSFQVSESATAGPLEFTIPLEYSACDEMACDPPRELPVTATLTITQGGATGSAAPSLPDSVIGPNSGRLAVTGLRFDPATVAPGGETTLLIDVKPSFGWHFYGALEENGLPPSLSLKLPDGIKTAGKLDTPAGTPHDSYGILSYWVATPSTLKQKVRVAEGTPAGIVTLDGTFNYMACDESMCDPELGVAISASFAVTGSAASGASTEATAKAGVGPSSDGASSDGADDEEGLLGFLLLAIGAGLLALAMPCTYPMIPITISFFTKQASDRGGSILPLSLAYGAGIVAIFIAIGLAAGPLIVPFAQHPVTNLVIGVVFVIFALSLFGLITLNPPAFLMRGATSASRKGGYLGVFLMGMALVVTSFTCTMPFVGTLLSVSAKSGDYGRIALGMGAFGLTMAIPFVFLSLLPGRMSKMPKSGQWMSVLKVTLGFVELAASIKFFSSAEYAWEWHILPRELFFVILAAISTCCTFYLFGFINLKGEGSEIGPGRLLAGTISMIVTFYFGFGALGYNLDNPVMHAFEPPYKAERLGAILNQHSAEESDVGGVKITHDPHTIVWDDFDAAVALAKQKEMAVLINFTAKT